MTKITNLLKTTDEEEMTIDHQDCHEGEDDQTGEGIGQIEMTVRMIGTEGIGAMTEAEAGAEGLEVHGGVVVVAVVGEAGMFAISVLYKHNKKAQPCYAITNLRQENFFEKEKVFFFI